MTCFPIPNITTGLTELAREFNVREFVRPVLLVLAKLMSARVRRREHLRSQTRQKGGQLSRNLTSPEQTALLWHSAHSTPRRARKRQISHSPVQTMRHHMQLTAKEVLKSLRLRLAWTSEPR